MFQTPQELLLLSVDGLVAELHQGNSAGTPYNLMALRVNFAQVRSNFNNIFAVI